MTNDNNMLGELDPLLLQSILECLSIRDAGQLLSSHKCFWTDNALWRVVAGKLSDLPTACMPQEVENWRPICSRLRRRIKLNHDRIFDLYMIDEPFLSSTEAQNHRTMCDVICTAPNRYSLVENAPCLFYCEATYNDRDSGSPYFAIGLKFGTGFKGAPTDRPGCRFNSIGFQSDGSVLVSDFPADAWLGGYLVYNDVVGVGIDFVSEEECLIFFTRNGERFINFQIERPTKDCFISICPAWWYGIPSEFINPGNKPFLYDILNQPFEPGARSRNLIDARPHLYANRAFSSSSDSEDSFSEY